jgi:RTX calcium-binding nonapeptide repeat (4 copies)
MKRKSMCARLSGPRMSHRLGRRGRARPRQLEAGVERLESRGLLSGGSVVLSQGLVTITPASVGPNIAVVSYQSHNGASMLDVNLNGVDSYFSLSQVGFVYYKGSGTSGAQTFVDRTSLHTVAWGGSGTNVFQAGSGQDTCFGGSGSNTFYAGSGYDVLVGGAGPNVFNENAVGSGQILKVGLQNSVNVPRDATGVYWIV